MMMNNSDRLREVLRLLNEYAAAPAERKTHSLPYETKDSPALPYETKDSPARPSTWLGIGIPSSISRKAAAPRVADAAPAERDSISPERWQRIKRKALIADVRRILAE